MHTTPPAADMSGQEQRPAAAGLVAVYAGTRVTHTRRMLASCDETGHRTGTLTGRTETDRQGFKRAEVTWDCGHVRWPRVRILTVAGEMTDEWRDTYRSETDDFGQPELAAGYHALGLPPLTAAAWASMGFMPGEALPWIAEGYGPAAADWYWPRYFTPAQVRAAGPAAGPSPFTEGCGL